MLVIERGVSLFESGTTLVEKIYILKKIVGKTVFFYKYF